MKPAFSTVATPDWTLGQLADFAADSGWQGIELRTFGHHSTGIACEPCHTSPAKVQDLFSDAGTVPLCLASSVRMDLPRPADPLDLIFGDNERPVRHTKQLVEVASDAEIPFVRVFAFESGSSETRSGALRRICDRLDLAARTARHTGVRLLLENGGSFARAADLIEILDRVASPHLGAAYNVSAALAAGDDPAHAVVALGPHLETVKLTDTRDARPCALGSGDLPVEPVVRALGARGFAGWLVYEYPRLWLADLPEPRPVLEASVQTLYAWAGSGSMRASHAVA